MKNFVHCLLFMSRRRLNDLVEAQFECETFNTVADDLFVGTYKTKLQEKVSATTAIQNAVVQTVVESSPVGEQSFSFDLNMNWVRDGCDVADVKEALANALFVQSELVTIDTHEVVPKII